MSILLTIVSHGIAFMLGVGALDAASDPEDRGSGGIIAFVAIVTAVCLIAAIAIGIVRPGGWLPI